MKIISWNVNGIRAWHKKGKLNWIIKEKPDMFCFQETKAHPDQLPLELKEIKGYIAYFDHSKGRKGYSGVAIYTKIAPLNIDYGLGVEELDQEGRFIALHFEEFTLINIYFPNGGGGPIRLDFKMKYYDAFLEYVDKLKKKGVSVIFCGDVNTAHTEIDLARPKENAMNTGFLPQERKWIDKVISHGYIDTFRFKNGDIKDKYTYWDMKTFARERNVGWRIDYFFVSEDLKDKIKKASIYEDITGSDHCPLLLELK